MIDTSTLVIWNGVALALLGLLLLAYWHWLARAGNLLWWSLPYFFGLLAVVTAFNKESLPPGWEGRLTTLFIMLAYAAVWQAAREFHHRPLAIWPAAGLVGLWLGVSLALGAAAPYGAALLRGVIIAGFNGFAAYEFWRRRRREPLPSRIAIVAILGANALFQGITHLLAPLLPAPLGLGPDADWAVVTYHLAVLFTALSVTVLVISLSRERVAEKYHQMAIHDPLTGLLNRSTFEAHGEEAGEAPAAYALLVIDIDHFKKINDGFGHHVGDAVIVHAARTIEQGLRRSDLLYRFGGEEFVCVLPQADLAQGEAVAERIRAAFAETVVNVPEGEVRATLSIGVAAARGGAEARATILANADAALYVAKRSGRNRVVAATLEGAPLYTPAVAEGPPPPASGA